MEIWVDVIIRVIVQDLNHGRLFTYEHKFKHVFKLISIDTTWSTENSGWFTDNVLNNFAETQRSTIIAQQQTYISSTKSRNK